MVDVISKRCDHPDGCSKRPYFGQPGSRVKRCTTHKEPGMVGLYRKRCDHPDASGPGTSPHLEHGPVMPNTAVGSAVSGRLTIGCMAGGRGARGVRSVPATASSGPAALLSRGIRMLAASRKQVLAANPTSSVSPAGAARGIGKRSRQDAPVPAPVPTSSLSPAGATRGLSKRSRQDASVPVSEPNKQQAAGGDGRSHKRTRGMVQALSPQPSPAGLSAIALPPPPPHSAATDTNTTQAAPTAGPSAGAPPPPPQTAISRVVPRRTLRRPAAVSAAPLAETQVPHRLVVDSPNKRYGNR